MVTGASTADLALILVDARKGIIEQSRRHAFIASLLGVPHLVVVREQDGPGRLVARSVFDEIRDEFSEFAAQLDVARPDVHPDLRAPRRQRRRRARRTCRGTRARSLLHHLEHVHIASDRNLVDVRFPVQYVIRPQSDEHHDYRGYAGTGRRRRAQARATRCVALPVRASTSTIASIETPDGPVDEAFPPMSVDDPARRRASTSVRGDMICRPHNQPAVTQDIDAMVCWMDEPAHSVAGQKLRDQAHDPLGARGREASSTTASTSTRCTATRPRRRSRSTRSGGSGCGPRRRCSSTSTGATAPPGASS